MNALAQRLSSVPGPIRGFVAGMIFAISILVLVQLYAIAQVGPTASGVAVVATGVIAAGLIALAERTR